MATASTTAASTQLTFFLLRRNLLKAVPKGNLFHQNNNEPKDEDLLNKAKELLKSGKDLLDSNNSQQNFSKDAVDSTNPNKDTLPLIDKGNLKDMRDQIYCSGSLLDAVQKSSLFTDCKTFVDMPLKQDAETILLAWNLLLKGVENGQIDPSVLKTFVQEHFEQPGGELEDYHPTDFNAGGEQYSNIVDPNFRSWAMELHKKWPTLCRRVSSKVISEPNRFSLIALPKPFVIPGGRFREMYYWDSFFTMKGLLASGMFETVRGMIENMGHMIDLYGFVPNGNRVYYLNRSQPPLLTWCVNAYFEATNDLEFVRLALTWLEKEMEFFTNNKKFSHPSWKSYLFRYHVIAKGPRPESYREDVECAEHISDDLEKHRLWGDIAAAAESGRDFSARWFKNIGNEAGKMGSTRTSSIIPVDLNAIICGNLRIFAHFYDLLGNPKAAESSRQQFQLMREAIHQVFWNEEHGCWFDYDLATDQQIIQYYDTNFFPLFTGSVHDGFNPHSIVEYLNRAGALGYPGGLPTSMITSGQQWDFPNAWAPTTWILIEGLRLNGEPELARQIAEKWIRRNYGMWLNSGGRMYEKYDVATGCFKSGGGGEYEVQEGFGWTNGVILDLLRTYQSEINWNADSVEKCSCCPPRIPQPEEIARLDEEKAASERAAAAAAAALLEPVILAAAAAQMNQRRDSVSQCDAPPLLIPPPEAPQQVIIDCAAPLPKIEV